MTEFALAAFREHRRELFGIAYRMLGSVADAEDILQDAWLKWSAVDASDVDQPRAYLARTVTNLCSTSSSLRRRDGRPTSAPGCLSLW